MVNLRGSKITIEKVAVNKRNCYKRTRSKIAIGKRTIFVFFVFYIAFSIGNIREILIGNVICVHDFILEM
jgi:hypothetical protein